MKNKVDSRGQSIILYFVRILEKHASCMIMMQEEIHREKSLFQVLDRSNFRKCSGLAQACASGKRLSVVSDGV